VSAGQKPTKGVRPNFDGVDGIMLAARDVPSAVMFGSSGRKSPYDAKLRQLVEAGDSSVLCFGDTRARASVWSRAKKLGIKIECGEHANKLYVRLLKASAAPDAPSVKTAVVADVKVRNRSAILDALRRSITTPEAIAADLRTKGHNLDAPIVRSMLKSMQSDGTAKLARVSPEKWEPAV
jgi:hypothetical protein